MPNAKILLVEMSGIPLSDEQIQKFMSAVDIFIDCSNRPEVKKVFDESNNASICKNVTEVGVFGMLLQFLIDNKLHEEYDRIFKISGRYQLTDNFNTVDYDKLRDRIVVAKSWPTYYASELTGGIEKAYMTRLWSWPANITQSICKIYKEGFDLIVKRIESDGFIDIEHMLFKLLPPDLVTEVNRVGVKGWIGGSGDYVED